MFKQNHWAPTLIAVAFAGALAACSGERADDRTALRDDELSRELDLALRGDTAMPTFGDGPVVAEPESVEPPVQAPRPEPQPQAPPRATPQPQPRQQAPRQPSPEPPPVSQPAPQPRWATLSAPSGSTAAVTLNETLSTETNRVGDTFTATLAEAIRDGMGNVVVPAGATVRGRVTQVETSGRVGETALLKLAFEQVSFGGSSYPLNASVIEAHPQRSTRQSTAEQAAKVGAGAAAGAVLGRVIGRNTRSTVAGAAVGAAAGTAIAMGTADVDAVLPTGSRMVIRLDGPVEVRRPIS
jgi:hypothetical protein